MAFQVVGVASNEIKADILKVAVRCHHTDYEIYHTILDTPRYKSNSYKAIQ